ncbi:MAG: hypothetical protein ABIG46_05085 [Candidatus Omnitrophota bacterium]
MKRYKLLLIIVVYLTALIIYSLAINNSPWLITEDTALHIIAAKSISQGKGFTITSGPSPQHLRYYPYLYPFLLSLLMPYSGGTYSIYIVFSIFLSMILGFFLFFIIKGFFKKSESIWIIPLFMLNAQVAIFSRVILTDMPYTVFSICAVYFISSYIRRQGNFNRFIFPALLFTALSFYTRLLGVSLVVSFVVYLFMKKEFKKAFFISVFCLLIVSPWAWDNLIAGKSVYIKEFNSHTSGFGGFLFRYIYNLLATIGKELPDLFFYPFMSNIDPLRPVAIFKFITGSLIFLALVRGAFIKIKEEGVAYFDIYLGTYIIIFYLSWVYHGARLLLPLLPFLLYYLIYFVKMHTKKNSYFITVLSVLIFLSIVGNIKEIAQIRMTPFTPAQDSYRQAIDWLKERAHKDDIILSRNVGCVYLYTRGIRGVSFIRRVDNSAQLNNVIKNNARYVIIDQVKIHRDTVRDYLLPMVKAYPDYFQKIYETRLEPKTVVYKVIR